MFSSRNESEDSEVLTGEDVAIEQSGVIDEADFVGIVSSNDEARVAEPFAQPYAPPANPAPASVPAPATSLAPATSPVEPPHFGAAATVSIPTGYAPRMAPEPPAAAHADTPQANAPEVEVSETVVAPVSRRSLLGEATAPEPRPAPSHAAPLPPAAPAHGADFDVLLSTDGVVLADASVLPTVPSRAGARWLSAILTVALTPVAWYLLSDAAVRLSVMAGQLWETQATNPAALIELSIGLLIVILIAVIAAQSGIGLIVSGVLALVVGIPFLAAPVWSTDVVDRYLGGLRDSGAFGGNVVGCLMLTGLTGVLVIIGVLFISLGTALATTRRAGRREEATRVMVAAANAPGIKARWARKATERAQNS